MTDNVSFCSMNVSLVPMWKTDFPVIIFHTLGCLRILQVSFVKSTMFWVSLPREILAKIKTEQTDRRQGENTIVLSFLIKKSIFFSSRERGKPSVGLK